MGLDAESSDLTARIQARRRALVLAGEVAPALPGERVIHGRQPGAHDAFEVTGSATARASEARARRAAASQEVVEMDYTDYSEDDEPAATADAPAPVSEDADEPFDVEDGIVPEPDPDLLLPEDDEATATIEYAERLLAGDDDTAALELRLAGVEAALEQLTSDSGAHFEGLGAGFLALAKGLSDELASIRASLDAQPVPERATEQPTPKKPWWKFLLGSGSGPYE